MRYLLIVITFFMGFSSLPAWAMDWVMLPTY